MTNRYFVGVIFLVTLIAFGLRMNEAEAAGAENYKLVDGVAIYFGIMPGEVIFGHANEPVEHRMHGGESAGAHNDHLTVALFDAATGKRISDAQVTATVQELGLAGQTKKLEPMEIAGTITYGNYFRMPDRGTYRIVVKIRRPGVTGEIDAAFTHQHVGE